MRVGRHAATPGAEVTGGRPPAVREADGTGGRPPAVREADRTGGRPPAVRGAGRTGGRHAAAFRLVVLVGLVLAWEAATRAAGNPFFPSPGTIVARMHTMWFSGPPATLFLTDTAIGNILPSLGRMALGLAGGALAGVLLGLAVGLSARAYDYLDGVLQFLRAIPPPALVTVFVVLFGFGLRMQLAFIMFSVMWPVLLNTADGARSVEPLHLQTCQVFRMSRAERVRRVVLPSALPKMFAGLRLALSLSLIVMVFSELLPGTTNGIGFQLTDAYATFDLPAMWAGIVLLGVLGYLFNELFLTVERRVLAWHHEAQRLAD
ncbi:ABC transporter permease [Nonomuraea sp. NPDC050404]|uniref:ABC transporter permease n=1 Tax=Nonomuraea sp. NPDC050404 TaxID=3155783 RepID=UPI0033FCC14D